MIRTSVVQLTTIPAVAYRQKLPAGGSGVTICRDGEKQCGIAAISTRSGKAIPAENCPVELYPAAAFEEAIELTRGLPYKKLGKVTKCEMCADRLAKGEEPVCVASCPMGAIRVIDLNDPENAQYADTLPGLPPTNMTKPATRFVLPLEQKQDWRAE